jgi:hypothetical protein
LTLVDQVMLDGVRIWLLVIAFGVEDGLAGVGPADTEAPSGDGDASVLVDASHRTQWGLPVVAVAPLRVVFREVWRGGSDLAALARS